MNIDEKLVNIKEQLTELQEDFLRIFGKNLEHIATEAIKDKAIHFKDTEISRIKKNIQQAIKELSREAWYLDASEIAIGLGAPLLTNMVMVGTLIGNELIPLEGEDFERHLRAAFQREKLTLNLEAFASGVSIIRKQVRG